MYFSKETEKSLYLILKPLKILQTLQKNAYSRIIIVTLQTHILRSHYKNGSNKDNYQSGKGKRKPPTVTRLTAMHRKRPVPESLLNKVLGLQPEALSKKRLRYSCLPLKFSEQVFYRTPPQIFASESALDFTTNDPNIYC